MGTEEAGEREKRFIGVGSLEAQARTWIREDSTDENGWQRVGREVGDREVRTPDSHQRGVTHYRKSVLGQLRKYSWHCCHLTFICVFD